jgi:HlyD family secretion protein
MTAHKIVGLAALALTLSGLAGCGDGAPAEYQGYATADFVYVGAEESGRIATLAVKRGDTVKAGAPLFALDATVYRAEREQAAAQLQRAKAALAKLQVARQQPEEIDVLKARERQAEAALALSTEELARQRRLRARGVTPVATLDKAESQYRHDRAALDEIREQITLGGMPAREHDIAVAKAEVEAAKAALKSAVERLDRRRIAAPVGATVQDVLYRPGEVVDAGRPVVVLLPPGNLRFRFYVPEKALAAMKVGARVGIACDGCAAGLTARISFISSEAEYTPPVIFSADERRKFVYRIEAVPEGAARALKPGQPLTVTVGGSAGAPETVAKE